MKRLLVITGLLLIASPVRAACPETSFAQKLANQEPIGDYAKAVVERVNDGITRAKQAPAGTGVFDILVADWIAVVSSALLSLVDTKVEVVDRAGSLERRTACLSIDIAILQAKLEEVRCEMNQAVEDKKPAAIVRLKSLLIFLQKRVDHLQNGAVDTEYEDGGWQTWYPFDDPFMGWCCVQGGDTCENLEAVECLDAPGNFYPRIDQCLAETTCFEEGDQFDAPDTPRYDRACPFDSNYLAPNTSGYGCHPLRLEDYVNNIGLDEEEDGAVAEKIALEELNTQRDDFIDDVGHIKDITIALQQFMGETPDPRLNDFGNTKTDDIDYKHVAGCEADEPDDPNDPKPSLLWSAISLRSPFSFRREHLGVWQAFVRLMHRYSEDREIADRLKKPGEQWTEAERQQAAKEDNIFLWVIREQLRPFAQTFSYTQATLESAVYPKMVGGPEHVIEIMKPVRSVMKNIADLTDEPGKSVGDGKSLRTFGRDFAYYLRRTCLGRPCEEQLDSVLKIMFQDKCFPYTGGEYGKDQNALEECKGAAGL